MIQTYVTYEHTKVRYATPLSSSTPRTQQTPTTSIFLSTLTYSGRSGNRIRVRDEIFRTRPDRPWSPPTLLKNGYRVPFVEVKQPRRGVDHRPAPSAEIKERVELYFYSPSGHSWPVLG
jgi:hypothetical protein